MKKPLSEVLKVTDTVEDLIKVLMTVPKNYTLHPLGQQCIIGVDYVHECIYADDPNCIGEYTYDVIEEAKENGEPTEIEVSEESLETYKPEIWVVTGAQGGNESILGVFNDLEKAEACGTKALDGVYTSYGVKQFKLE